MARCRTATLTARTAPPTPCAPATHFPFAAPPPPRTPPPYATSCASSIAGTNARYGGLTPNLAPWNASRIMYPNGDVDPVGLHNTI